MPIEARRASRACLARKMAGVRCGEAELPPPAPLPALLYGRTPTFTNLALYATALANFVLPSTICTGHLKRRDRKRNGHSGLGLLIRYTAPFCYTNIRYLSPLASHYLYLGYLPSKPGIPLIERDTYNDQ